MRTGCGACRSEAGLRTGTADPSAGRSGCGFHFPQVVRLRPSPAIPNERGAELLADHDAIAHWPATRIMTRDRAIHAPGPHERRERICRRRAAIQFRPAVAMADRPSRRCQYAFQHHDMLADPQSGAIQNGQISGTGGNMAVVRSAGRSIRRTREQPTGEHHGCHSGNHGDEHAWRR